MATTTEPEKQHAEAAVDDGRGETKGPPHGLLREYFESGVVVAVMALFFMTFVAQAAEVPSASMENTIYVGDRFLINKFIFGPGPAMPFLPQREIRRGDIIVFRYPSDINTDNEIVKYKTLFIKRVIGLPGETIEVKGSDIYVDGNLLPEYRVTTHDPDKGNDKAELKKLEFPGESKGDRYAVFYTTSPSRAGTYGVGRPFRIPEGQYFMMGDNRDNSTDSRVWGPVPRDLIVGRAMFVIYSYDQHAPADGNFIQNFFINTRWGRIGTFIR
ncbi:MAG TPA: signal peptidase I [Pyrinomonadaceae bacterium]|nr:signal peptidase I [Pyrinomonadaceae bacterium]